MVDREPIGDSEAEALLVREIARRVGGPVLARALVVEQLLASPVDREQAPLFGRA